MIWAVQMHHALWKPLPAPRLTPKAEESEESEERRGAAAFDYRGVKLSSTGSPLVIMVSQPADRMPVAGHFDYEGERNGAPCYSRREGPGALYYDGSHWKICQAGKGKSEEGWNFSQTPLSSASPGDNGELTRGPPLGAWDKAKRLTSECARDYTGLSLSVEKSDEPDTQWTARGPAAEGGEGDAKAAEPRERDPAFLRLRAQAKKLAAASGGSALGAAEVECLRPDDERLSRMLACCGGDADLASLSLFSSLLGGCSAEVALGFGLAAPGNFRIGDDDFFGATASAEGDAAPEDGASLPWAVILLISYLRRHLGESAEWVSGASGVSEASRRAALHDLLRVRHSSSVVKAAGQGAGRCSELKDDVAKFCGLQYDGARRGASRPSVMAALLLDFVRLLPRRLLTAKMEATSRAQSWRQQAHEAQLGIQRAVSVTAALASPLPTGAGSDGEDDEGLPLAPCDREAYEVYQLSQDPLLYALAALAAELGGDSTESFGGHEAEPEPEAPAEAPASEDPIRKLQRQMSASRAPSSEREPTAIQVSGAGSTEANGRFVRDGDYGGCPRYVLNNLWILRSALARAYHAERGLAPPSQYGRYTMPSGVFFWYITDKNRLDRDDGDLYRVRSDAQTPPCDVAWDRAQDGRTPCPSFEASFAEVEACRNCGATFSSRNELFRCVAP